MFWSEGIGVFPPAVLSPPVQHTRGDDNSCKIDNLMARFALNAEAVDEGLRGSCSGLVTGVCVHQSSGDALTDEGLRLAKSVSERVQRD